jgi:hypothetical protein
MYKNTQNQQTMNGWAGRVFTDNHYPIIQSLLVRVNKKIDINFGCIVVALCTVRVQMHAYEYRPELITKHFDDKPDNIILKVHIKLITISKHANKKRMRFYVRKMVSCAL